MKAGIIVKEPVVQQQNGNVHNACRKTHAVNTPSTSTLHDTTELWLIIQMYLEEDLINTGSIRILYMTFKHRLKEPEVAVMFLE